MPGTPFQNVVLVDDSNDELFLTQMYFKRQKFDVTLQHYPGLDTFLAAFAHVPQDVRAVTLYVFDMNLALSRGTEGIRALRQDENGRDLFAGICTGSDDPADQKAAEEAGADFYVGKPLSLDRIEDVAEQVDALEMVKDADGVTRLYRR